MFDLGYCSVSDVQQAQNGLIKSSSIRVFFSYFVIVQYTCVLFLLFIE